MWNYKLGGIVLVEMKDNNAIAVWQGRHKMCTLIKDPDWHTQADAVAIEKFNRWNVLANDGIVLFNGRYYKLPEEFMENLVLWRV